MGLLDAPRFSRAKALTTFAPAATNTVVLIGTSLDEQNAQGVDTVDPKFDGTGTPAMRARGWFHWANAFLGDQLKLIRNSGIGGNRYDQMLARFEADVLAYSPRIIVIGSATNDVTGSRTYTQIVADLDAMIALAQGIGARVFVQTIAPRTTINTAARKGVAFEVNRYIHNLAQTHPNAAGLDFWTPICDPATNDPAKGTTIDGTHFSIPGAARIGLSAANTMRPYLGVRPTVTSGSADPRRFIADPAFVTQTGWAAATATTVTFEDVVPWGKRMVLTVAGNANLTSMSGASFTENLSNGLFAVGETLQLSARLKWSNLVPLTGNTPCYPVLRIEFRTGTTVLKTAYALYAVSSEFITYPTDSTYPVPQLTSGEGVFTTYRNTVPAGCDNVRVLVGWVGAQSARIEVSDLAALRDSASVTALPNA